MKKYQVKISEFAYSDLKKAKKFYEKIDNNLGEYFYDSIVLDIKSLQYFAKIHKKEYGYYRLIAKRFPFSIYYKVKNDIVIVVAILDQRKNPIVNYTEIENR